MRTTNTSSKTPTSLLKLILALSSIIVLGRTSALALIGAQEGEPTGAGESVTLLVFEDIKTHKKWSSTAVYISDRAALTTDCFEGTSGHIEVVDYFRNVKGTNSMSMRNTPGLKVDADTPDRYNLLLIGFPPNTYTGKTFHLSFVTPPEIEKAKFRIYSYGEPWKNNVPVFRYGRIQSLTGWSAAEYMGDGLPVHTKADGGAAVVNERNELVALGSSSEHAGFQDYKGHVLTEKEFEEGKGNFTLSRVGTDGDLLGLRGATYIYLNFYTAAISSGNYNLPHKTYSFKAKSLGSQQDTSFEIKLIDADVGGGSVAELYLKSLPDATLSIEDGSDKKEYKLQSYRLKN